MKSKHYLAVAGLAVVGFATAAPSAPSAPPGLVAPASTAPTIRWESLGPGGNGAWRRAGVVFETTDPQQPIVALMGTDEGFVFKTVDDGSAPPPIPVLGLPEWHSANEAVVTVDDASNEVYNIQDIVHARSNAGDDVVFVASKDLYRSLDLGATWDNPINDVVIFAVAVDVLDSSKAYALKGQNEIYVSTDGGSTFPTLESSLDGALSGCPGHPGTLTSDLVAIGNTLLAATSCGLWRTTDLINWSAVTTGLPTGADLEIVKLESNESGSLVYLMTKLSAYSTSQDSQAWAFPLYKSNDAGLTWSNASGVDGADLFDLTSPLTVAVDGDFETSGGAGGLPDGWSLTGFGTPGITQSSDSFSGASSLELNMNPCATASCSQPGVESAPFDVLPDRYYVARMAARNVTTPATDKPLWTRIFWFRKDATGACDLTDPVSYLGCPGTNSNLPLWSGPSSASTDWTYFERPFRAPPGAQCAQIKVFSADDSARVRFDALSIRPARTLARNKNQAGEPSVIDYQTLAVAPSSGGGSAQPTLYVGTDKGSRDKTGQLSGVWRSLDDGDTWKLVTREYPASARNVMVHERAPMVSTFFPTSLLAAGPQGRVYFGNDRFLMRSLNHGATWSEVTGKPVPAASGVWSPSDALGTTNNIVALTVETHPHRPDHIYYGDADGGLVYSTNDGESFSMTGLRESILPSEDLCTDDTIGVVDPVARSYARAWRHPVEERLLGDAATSIILRPGAGPSGPDTIYAGVYYKDTEHAIDAGHNDGGVFKGTWDLAADSWDWTRLGATDTSVKGGGIQIALDEDTGQGQALLYAVVYNPDSNPADSLVWRRDPTSPDDSAWTSNAIAGSCPYAAGDANVDAYCHRAYRLAKGPDLPGGCDRLFVAFGDPTATFHSPPPAEPVGVWVSDDCAVSWSKVSSPILDGVPILELVPGETENELFVGAGLANINSTSIGGGLYRLACTSTTSDPLDRCASWSWDPRLLEQPRVTGIAQSAVDPNLLLAVSAHQDGSVQSGFRTGVHCSADRGASWTRLPSGGLLSYKRPRLKFSANDPSVLFAATGGNGLFRGTLTCNDDGVCDCGELEGVCGDCPLDSDADGVPDIADNCIALANTLQVDADGDGFGNSCDADVNNDCVIDFLDLGLMRLGFFSSDPVLDFNSDGRVDFLDLGRMKEDFFGTPGPSSQTDACVAN